MAWDDCERTVATNLLILAHVNYDGTVAACGLVGGFDLPTTVMPFIVRGVKLLGVDSAELPGQKRQQAWLRLTERLPSSFYEQACHEIGLEEVIDAAEKITNGQITGRVVIRF